MTDTECAEEPADLVDACDEVRKNSSLMNVIIAYTI
jgi:hypothetical protein